MYCNECGNSLPDGVERCPVCGSKVKVQYANNGMNDFNNGQKNDPVQNQYQNDRMGYVNNNYGEDSSLSGIVLSENEQLVRQYHCSSVKQPRCEGYLSVTTRRMIFQAEGGTFFRSRISKEISLDKVTGVDCYYGVNMKITQIIVGVILTILGFYAWGINSSYIGSGRFYSFLIMILGIVLIVSGIRKSFKLTIYASECSPSPINIGEGALSLQGNAVFYAIVSEPTTESSPVPEDETTDNEQENQTVTDKKVIVLDPGHSAVVATGTEPLGPGSSEQKAADASGTRGISSGVPEYELTLNISVQLKEVLEQRGYQVVLTRESNNVPISCVQRAEVANNLNADVYVRIHANGSENSNAKGAMTICTTPNNPYNASIYGESKALSEAILDKYCEVTGCNKEYVWETDTMSGNNWSQVPVTIVEMGYMTNPEEDVLMQTAEYQQKMVQGIADGIDAYMENY